MSSPRLFSKCARAATSFRMYSVAALQPGLRPRLLADLKTAMKSKNTMASTTIRSVLSEVYAADKKVELEPAQIADGAIVSIIRKAALRRADNALQFEQASRPDLAEKEHAEHAFLTQFLPPLLPESEIDDALKGVITELGDAAAAGNPKKVLGQVFKAFYARVDKSSVDPEVVKKRAEVLLGA